MITLNAILAGLNYNLVQGQLEAEVAAIAFDSREVGPNGLFIAVPGTQVNGHDFIPQAVEKGASVIIGETIPDNLQEDITAIQVENSAQALALVTHNFYDRPSEELTLVGITGTNGKTTTATLLHNLYQELGFPSGLISTNGVKIGNQDRPATHTTPDPVQICQYLREMVNRKVRYVFMEVSSHALEQERVAGLSFAGGVFTNISHEHLDYHLTFDNYIKAKKRLFDSLPKDAFALVNLDDKQCQVMLQNTQSQQRTFGLKRMADYKGKILENDLTGMRLELNGHEVYSPITGRFNAYNLVAVYGVALELDTPENDVLRGISSLKPVEGRLEMLKNEQGVTGIVDYAHSPDALSNILNTIKEANQHGGNLYTVIGCGGDRDKDKRPQMAKIALNYSDKVIITSDNPRFEDPDAIIKEMETGIPENEQYRSLAIINRKEAIKTAVTLAQKGDIILVAGKGHEKYQEVEGQRWDFDDKAILNQLLNPETANT